MFKCLYVWMDVYIFDNQFSLFFEIFPATFLFFQARIISSSQYKKSFNVLGPRFVIELGDKTLDFNENFRLFLATRIPNPELPPNVMSILTTVNFTTTRAGLTGQVKKDF